MPFLFDENGTHRESGKNVCDCLKDGCPGCFFPCKSCGSVKCGRKCRSLRKWFYTRVVQQHPYDESTVIDTSVF